MSKITREFKEEVAKVLIKKHESYEGLLKDFLRSYNISASQLTKIKKGVRNNLMDNEKWIYIGRKLNIEFNRRRWNIAKTDVFEIIKEEVLFCQKHSKSRIFVDECAIGKTFTAKYLSRTLTNCFYVDASQGKTRSGLARILAQSLGLSNRYLTVDLMANIKYYLNALEIPPIVIVDEAGDLSYSAFLDLKELWNATENNCGWYMMGADGLKAKIKNGVKLNKVGYAELFSRFSESYSSVVPIENGERLAFYKKLIGDVLSVNLEDQSQIPHIIRKCLVNGGNFGGLRRAESLIILNS